jgi:hypothetical protein
MYSDDVFDRMAIAKGELAAPDHAATGSPPTSPATQALVAEQDAAHDQYDAHLAAGSFIRHNDQRSLDHKAAVPHPGDGNGGGWPGPGQPPPWWPPTKGGGGNGSGGGSGGGGTSGNGPPSWFKNWWQKQQQQRGGMQRGGGGGARIGGGQLAGPGALGNIPQLGKVPIAQAQPSTGPNPIVVVVLLAGAGTGGYLLYHKLKLAKHQNAELSQGKDPTPDAAT